MDRANPFRNPFGKLHIVGMHYVKGTGKEPGKYNSLEIEFLFLLDTE